MLRKTTSLRGMFAAALVAGAALAAPSVASAADAGTLAWGGRLYDDWTKITAGLPPAKVHPALPEANSKLARKAVATWRCKTCHGWDYRGKDGAYGGKTAYNTGIKGIDGFAGKSADDVLAVMKDGTHGYTEMMMPANEQAALAAFVAEGQIDMSPYIDGKTVKGGDAAKGKGYFEAFCASCHGFDGRKISGMDALAYEAGKNPQEALHKMLNGVPKEAMVAMRALPIQIAVDTLTYALTLPDEGMSAGDEDAIKAYMAAAPKVTVDPKSGDAAKGKDYFDTLCSGCHGLDGKKNMENRKKDGLGTLGAEAAKNPADSLQKILDGQPKKGMISLRALPEETAADVLAYVLTLPKE